MSSNKRSGKDISNENEKVSKKRCSLTGYSEKRTEDVLKKISEHPRNRDWMRWRKIRTLYKHCFITWSFIKQIMSSLRKKRIISDNFVINFKVFESNFTTSDLQRCFSDWSKEWVLN